MCITCKCASDSHCELSHLSLCRGITNSCHFAAAAKVVFVNDEEVVSKKQDKKKKEKNLCHNFSSHNFSMNMCQHVFSLEA